MGIWIQHPVKNRYSPYRDDIILDCFHRGILTGTSLMVFFMLENRNYDGVVQFLGKEGFIHAVTEGYIVPGEVEIELRNQVCIPLFVIFRFKSSSN